MLKAIAIIILFRMLIQYHARSSIGSTVSGAGEIEFFKTTARLPLQVIHSIKMLSIIIFIARQPEWF